MEQTANIVSFPGLGWEFEIDRVAFHIGSLPVYWYGILIYPGNPVCHQTSQGIWR